APPASVRVQQRLPGAPPEPRDAVHRALARRPPCRDRGASRPSLLSRHAVPPRVQVASEPPTPAVRRVHRGRARVRARARPRGDDGTPSAGVVRINVTLCFSVNQALLAAAIGAYIVSPFAGRLDDINEDGMRVVADIVSAYRQQSIKTKVLAASIRTPMHVTQAALAGADISTLP